jgi:hypothetical protein
MGFDEADSTRAALATQNEGVPQALDWPVEKASGDGFHSSEDEDSDSEDSDGDGDRDSKEIGRIHSRSDKKPEYSPARRSPLK